MTRVLRLRADAVDRLTAITGVQRLNRRQQAALLGMDYKAFWRLTNANGSAASATIAEVLTGAARLAERYGCKKPTFEDLFEIREIENEPAAAMAA
ncbi:hypothetical protein ABT369_39190 [Dactylosporangium sp. NPDC000244]|uniref:hypothetical protein n=1 Tax=Dactylosporangium sp. NPDC000244 TaxID=3154365 RepID=UPI00332CAA5F